MANRAANILLVEDNDGDVELMQIAFEHGDLSSRLSVAHDGVDALDYLLGRGAFANPAIPDLILLDLNMPRMDGKQFLGVVKQDDALKSIPVIVFSSSDAGKDIAESYQLHANSYIIKPFSLEQYIEVAMQVESFWIRLSQLPRH